MLESPGTVAALLAWGVVAGLDLVSTPQALLSRPLVVGLGAGALLGDIPTGLQVGLLLELFALDVLPVGASRYPDYGAATIGAVVLATRLGPWYQSLGVAAFYGLLLAALGGWSLAWHREGAGRALRAHAAGLAAGDQRTLARLHWRGVAMDAVRSLLLTLVAVLGAFVLARRVDVSPSRFALVSAVAVGAGLAAAFGGALRSAGRGSRLRWLAAGVGTGLVLAAVR
jgi:mannose/fructose/N-acetylgalactosamine-specific phosphotransferase system component IIC